MKPRNSIVWSLVSAAGVTLYVFVVATIVTKVGERLAPMPMPFGPFLMLLLLVLSVAVVGALIFGRPTLMYLEGKQKEALVLFFYTLGWIAVIFAVFLSFIAGSVS